MIARLIYIPLWFVFAFISILLWGAFALYTIVKWIITNKDTFDGKIEESILSIKDIPKRIFKKYVETPN